MGERSSDATIARLALVTVVTLEALHLLVPILYRRYETGGLVSTIVLAGLVFASPVLAPALAHGGRFGADMASLTLAVGVISVRLVRPVPSWLAAALTMVGLVTLTRELTRAGREAAIGLTVGVALATIVRAVSLTWDPVSQDGLGAIVLSVVWAGGLVATARSDAGAKGGGSSGVVAVGPFLLIEVLFGANIAFIASSAQLSLPWATASILAGCLVATLTAASVSTGASLTKLRAPAGAFLPVGVAAFAVIAVTAPTGPTLLAVPALVLIVQACVGLTLGMALSPDRSPSSRTPLAAAGGTLLFAGVLLLWQLGARGAVGLPRWVLPPIAGAILAAIALRSRPVERARAPTSRSVAIGLTLLAVGVVVLPAGIALSAPEGSALEARAGIRVLDWNVHGGVDADGMVDPDRLARAIEDARPDVVVLQEVGRGWPIGGGVDLAAWLSRRLAMPFRWAPSADGQFGNVILSRLPFVGSEAFSLPGPGDDQPRSALRVLLDVGEGRRLTVIAAQTDGPDGAQTAQFATLATQSAGTEATILAGDLNAQPGSGDLRILTRVGLASAQDTVGVPDATTARDPTHPGDRVDWIFGSADLRFSAFSIGNAGPSDHLPLWVTVRLTSG